MSRALISVEDVFADVSLPMPLTIWYGSEEIYDFEKIGAEEIVLLENEKQSYL